MKYIYKKFMKNLKNLYRLSWTKICCRGGLFNKIKMRKRTTILRDVIKNEIGCKTEVLYIKYKRYHKSGPILRITVNTILVVTSRAKF